MPTQMELKYRLIRTRALTEKFSPGRIHLDPLLYEPDPDKPKYVIRAVYGPVNGIATSRIQTYKHKDRYLARRIPDLDEDDLVGRGRHDTGVRGMSWGPRKFLWELFQEVAGCGGDCTIYMQHSGQEMQVDAELFAEWVARSWRDPARALLEPATLLLEGS